MCPDPTQLFDGPAASFLCNIAPLLFVRNLKQRKYASVVCYPFIEDERMCMGSGASKLYLFRDRAYIRAVYGTMHGPA